MKSKPSLILSIEGLLCVFEQEGGHAFMGITISENDLGEMIAQLNNTQVKITIEILNDLSKESE